MNEELKSRRVRNPRYSLRSYARFLELDPSYLSKLLKSKRVLHPAMAQHCALKLGWTDLESNPEAGQPLRDSYRTLDVDSFHLISQWHHYAIFELLKVKRSWSEQKIAEALEIDRSVAIDAIGRLLRLGLIKKTLNGFSRTPAGITTVGHKFSTAAFRNLQRNILEMAQGALEEVPMERRDQSSMTMAIAESEIPKAKQMLKRFRRRFCTQMQTKGTLDSVYHLSLSFYPVTKQNEKRGKKCAHN